MIQLETQLSTQLNDMIASISRMEKSITTKLNQGIEFVKFEKKREFQKMDASLQTFQWGLQNGLGNKF